MTNTTGIQPHLYIGMMSGTSLDGIDAVILDGRTNELVATEAYKFPNDIQAELYRLITDAHDLHLADVRELHAALAGVYAGAARTLLKSAAIDAHDIAAIGNHGQTVCHRPDATPPWTLQLGDPQTLANLTGITVVGDFRSADMKLGGQGAPLVPAFHKAVIARPGISQAVVNIGGIANVTLIDATGNVTGFDTGPGNTLMDEWSRRHRAVAFDNKGEWAASGKVDPTLLDVLLEDSWLNLPPPKSTGREYFNLHWLDNLLGKNLTPAADVQATLCELTAITISNAIARDSSQPEHIAICGGGAHNRHLLQRLSELLPNATVTDTSDYGIGPDWVEAAAFAWLAKARLEEMPANIPAVTGASAPVLLGDIYHPQ